MPELRIALIMGGGVSLGSFSGGALSQVLRLLEQVERGPAKIDVVTGASAGSMTLGVVLYHLFRGSSLDRIQRALREAWVERISFEGLNPDLAEHQSPSLFSDRVLRAIARDSLRFDAWDDAEPHPYFAEGTLVSFALTNLNGIPVRTEAQLIRQEKADGSTGEGRESVFADALQTTFHDDAIRFELRRRPDAGDTTARRVRARTLLPWTTEERRAEWVTFRAAAIASGAFPAAFPPVRLPRRREEYGIWPEELPEPAFAFDYVDGGVLRNEPLREAVHLAAERDEGHDVERVFVFIDPNVSGTRETFALAHNQRLSLTEEVDDWGEPRRATLESPTYMGRLVQVLGRFAGVLASQAAFRDWLRAARVNSQVEWRDELLGVLAEVQPVAGSDAEGRIERLLRTIYRDKVERTPGERPGEGDEESRIEEAIEHDLRRRARGGPVTFATRLGLLVDLVANLREKRKLNMVAVTPGSAEGGASLPIAGNFLSNFGGFFNPRYRDHDFRVGEHVAARVLTTPIEGGERPARRLLREGVPVPPPPRWTGPDPSYRMLSAEIQQRFEEMVEGHARAVAPLLGIPRLLAGTVAGILRGRVRSALVGERGGVRAAFLLRIHGVQGKHLRAIPTGSDQGAGGDGTIETVVAVRLFREGTVRGELGGPHLHGAAGGQIPTLEVWERRGLFGGRRLVTRIRLQGRPADWFRRSTLCATPVLEVTVPPGAEEVVATPEELGDVPYRIPDD